MANVARLAGCRILVVEDDWFISRDMERLLAGQGADLIGPVASVDEALDLVRRDGFDLAIIDIKLDNELAYPVADELKRRGMPFAFATGYSADVIPPRFLGVPYFEKPFEAEVVIAEAHRLCQGRQH